jgi:ABC-2 type transport system ATP-binding protein
VIEASRTERQTTLIVRSNGPIVDPAWTIEPTSLEDVVLAYMGRGRSGGAPPIQGTSD